MITSGAMYSCVPQKVYVRCVLSSSRFAVPKSINFMLPCAVGRYNAGLSPSNKATECHTFKEPETH